LEVVHRINDHLQGLQSADASRCTRRRDPVDFAFPDQNYTRQAPAHFCRYALSRE
jgi:hypothetical protein